MRPYEGIDTVIPPYARPRIVKHQRNLIQAVDNTFEKKIQNKLHIYKHILCRSDVWGIDSITKPLPVPLHVNIEPLDKSSLPINFSATVALATSPMHHLKVSYRLFFSMTLCTVTLTW